jgi:hypothetical protein
MLAKPSDGRRALDNWARDEGYSDFDTYVRGGGSALDARQGILRRIARLTAALRWLGDFPVAQRVADQALAEPEAAVAGDDPPDPGNAHPQGDDHVG